MLFSLSLSHTNTVTICFPGAVSLANPIQLAQLLNAMAFGNLPEWRTIKMRWCIHFLWILNPSPDLRNEKENQLWGLQKALFHKHKLCNTQGRGGKIAACLFRRDDEDGAPAVRKNKAQLIQRNTSRSDVWGTCGTHSHSQKHQAGPLVNPLDLKACMCAPPYTHILSNLLPDKHPYFAAFLTCKTMAPNWKSCCVFTKTQASSVVTLRKKFLIWLLSVSVLVNSW